MNSRASEPDSKRPATTDELLSHADWVRRLSRALLSDPNAAEDVAQDAWVAALKRPPTAGAGMRAWWARVVRSTASNHRRSEVRRADREQRVASERAEATDPQVESTLEAHRRLAAAIEALDETLRAVIVAHFFHGASSREIAEREGVADSTIRTRLQKALEKLRRELDERAGGDRKAWAGLLAPLAKLDSGALPAAATAVVISTWIKLAAGVALVGLAGVAAYRFLDSTHEQAKLESSAPAIAATAAPSEVSAPVATERRAETPAAPAAGALAASSVKQELVATVDARVLDVHGLPIRGARLQFIDKSAIRECKNEEAPQSLSDSSGRVTVSIRATDRSRRRATRSGLTANTWDALFEFSCRGYATRRATATLVLGQATALGDVVLTEGADVLGRCIGTDGEPLAEVRVYLIYPDLSLAERDGARRGSFGREDTLAGVVCSSDGSFAIHGVPAGAFRVWGSAQQRAQTLSEPFTVSAGEEHVLPDLVLAECADAVRGKLLMPDGSPCSRGWIEYTMNDSGEWTDRRCEKDGSFLLDRSTAALLNLCGRDSEGTLGQALLSGVRPGESGIVLRLPPPRTIEVHVSDATGAPIERYSLGVFHTEDYSGQQETFDAPGGVHSILAGARPFRVRVEARGFAPQEQAPFRQADAPEAIYFKLQRGAVASGRVLLEGVPKPYVQVELFALRAEPRVRVDGMPDLAEGDSSWDFSDKDGVFSIAAGRDGRFALTAKSASGTHAVMRMLELGVNHPIEGLDLELTEVGSIEGRVEGRDPGSQAPLFIMYSAGLDNPRFERVNEDGSFLITQLAPGAWWLRPARTSLCLFELLPLGQAIEYPNLRRVVVVARSRASCAFDLAADQVRAIEGSVNMGDGALRGWTAAVSMDGTSNGACSSAAIPANGSFHLPVSTFGTQILFLRSTGTPVRDDRIETHVIVPADGLHWDLTCDLGTLEIEGKPAAQIQVLADLPNGATWTTHAILDANGRATLDALPAAKARVSVTGTKDSPVEVEIPARGRAQVRLP